jgi:hypothetical protein
LASGLSPTGLRHVSPHTIRHGLLRLLDLALRMAGSGFLTGSSSRAEWHEHVFPSLDRL